MTITCDRCRGSGTIGRKTDRYGLISAHGREAPGPVPDDVAGWAEVICPDCHGEGVLYGEEEDEDA